MYTLDGDSLLWCVNVEDDHPVKGRRPTAVESKPDSSAIVVRFGARRTERRRYDNPCGHSLLGGQQRGANRYGTLQGRSSRMAGMKLPRFQFRLRTLMIGVTLFCVVVGVYVGWQAKIVRERRAELNRTVDARLVGIAGNDEERVIPWIRRVLGDQRVGSIKMLVGTDVAELDRLRVLFPEAKVEVWTPAGSSIR